MAVGADTLSVPTMLQHALWSFNSPCNALKSFCSLQLLISKSDEVFLISLSSPFAVFVQCFPIVLRPFNSRWGSP